MAIGLWVIAPAVRLEEQTAYGQSRRLVRKSFSSSTATCVCFGQNLRVNSVKVVLPSTRTASLPGTYGSLSGQQERLIDSFRFRTIVVKVYFNPNCSKCRNAVAQLDDYKKDYELIRYLDSPLSAKELGEIVDMLRGPLSELVRKDKNFSALGLKAADYQTKDSVVTLLLEHPELMQRPILVKDGKATIARTIESVAEVCE